MTELPELRHAFSNCVHGMPFDQHRPREETELAADFAGLAKVRRLLLDEMDKARIRKPIEEKRLRRTGASWPFTQVASYPLGIVGVRTMIVE